MSHDEEVLFKLHILTSAGWSLLWSGGWSIWSLKVRSAMVFALCMSPLSAALPSPVELC